MSDVFEYLDAKAREENIPFKNAAAVAIDRAERRFGSFVAGSKGEKEFNSRIALVEEEILKIATNVCEEQGFDDPQHIARLILGQLEVLADRSTDSADTASIGNIERQTLKPMDPNGYYTDPTIALNPNSAGDHMHNTNPPIPELKPDDKQHPDDAKWPWNSDIPRTGDGLTQVDIDKPMQPEFNVGDGTMTFPNKGQADPVTSSKKKSNLGGGEPEDYAGEFRPLSELNNIKMRLAEGASVEDIQKEFSQFIAENDLSSEDIEALRIIGKPLDRLQSSLLKEAAERMDFNSIAEAMTPSEAVNHLVESGMEKHEASDRIYWYVNHVNPGWANKSWTAAVEDELDPDLLSEDEYTERDWIVHNQGIAKAQLMNVNKLPDEQVKFMGLVRRTRRPHFYIPPQKMPEGKFHREYVPKNIDQIGDLDSEILKITEEDARPVVRDYEKIDKDRQRVEKKEREEASKRVPYGEKVKRYVFQQPSKEEPGSLEDVLNKAGEQGVIRPIRKRDKRAIEQWNRQIEEKEKKKRKKEQKPPTKKRRKK